jgi:Zn-dependent membrane protease YugP
MFNLTYWYMEVLILLAFGLSIWAQFRVKGTFNRWSQVEAMSGLTGYEAARRMLDCTTFPSSPCAAC